MTFTKNEPHKGFVKVTDLQTELKIKKTAHKIFLKKYKTPAAFIIPSGRGFSHYISDEAAEKIRRIFQKNQPVQIISKSDSNNLDTLQIIFQEIRALRQQVDELHSFQKSQKSPANQLPSKPPTTFWCPPSELSTGISNKPPEKLLRLPAVMEIVGLQKSSIYEGVKNGTFPAPIKLSRRAVCWPTSAIINWVNKRMAAPAGIEPAFTPHQSTQRIFQ